MKDRNENRPGYKKTEVGWIPDEWEMKFVDELCSFSSGHGFRKQDWSTKGLPIIRIQNLNGSQNFNYFAGRPKKNWLVNEGDLLFAWAGVKGVSFGPKIWPGPKGVLNQHIYKIHPNINFEKEWIFLSLQRVTEEIEKKAHGFKSSLLHVHQQDITRQPVPYPPLPEQGKITEILSTWDDAIDQVHQLIDTKKRRQKGLMQQLLAGKRRLSNYHGTWKEFHLGELFKERKETNGDHLPLLAITGSRGVIPSP